MRMRNSCGVCGLLDHEFGAAAAGIAEGVARNLGNGGGDAGLVLPLEAEQFGNTARALTHRDDVALGGNRKRHNGPSHANPLTQTASCSLHPAESVVGRRSGHLPTRTVASSRRRP